MNTNYEFKEQFESATSILIPKGENRSAVEEILKERGINMPDIDLTNRRCLH